MANVLENLIDSPQWDWLNKQSVNGNIIGAPIIDPGRYPIFGTPNGPNAKNSNPVANQFSATSDYQMAVFELSLYPNFLYSSRDGENNLNLFLGDLALFLQNAWLRLTLNKQEVLVESVAKLLQYPFGALDTAAGGDPVAASGGNVGALKGRRQLGSAAPVIFPGGQTFQFDLIVEDGYQITGDTREARGFAVHFGCDGYEILRSGAQGV